MGGLSFDRARRRALKPWSLIVTLAFLVLIVPAGIVQAAHIAIDGNADPGYNGRYVDKPYEDEFVGKFAFVEEADAYYAIFIQDPDAKSNAYCADSKSAPGCFQKFGSLVGSDYIGFDFSFGFVPVDTISESSSAPSGYKSVIGEDGGDVEGIPASCVTVHSAMDYNLNVLGWRDFTNSPNFSGDPSHPYVYQNQAELKLDKAACGLSSGLNLNNVVITAHNSPKAPMPGIPQTPTPGVTPTPTPTPQKTCPGGGTMPPSGSCGTPTPTPSRTPTPTPQRTPTPTPTKTPGDESCPFNTFKFTTTNITDGNKTDGDFVVLVNYYGNNDKQFMAFKAQTSHVVKNLIVTGTGGSNRYNFNPAITGGQGFSEPASIQISSVTFCYIPIPATPTPTKTPPCSCGGTPTPVVTPTPVKTPTPTPVKTPTPTPVKTPTPTPTPCVCKTPTPTPTKTPTPTPTPTPLKTPTPTPFKTPSPTPTPVKTPTPTPTPTPCVCSTPTPGTGRIANQPPVPVISKPGSTYTWGASVIVGFGGSANDPEDGALAASKLSWKVIWHNGGDSVIYTASGISGGTFTAPGSLSGTIEIFLTATDSAGSSSTVSVVYNHR